MEWGLIHGAESRYRASLALDTYLRARGLMAPFEKCNRLPQYSRCHGDLIISTVMPQDDDHG